MTCIVGIVDAGRVHIGADSAGVANYELVQRNDRKVFKNGAFIMGFTSSFRMGQLLAFKLKPPKRHADDDVMTFMVTEFIDAVRDCLKAGGYAEKEKEVERGGNFLVGYAGRLFNIGSDYQVGESIHGFDACGSGESIALGSMASTVGRPTAERIARALSAAEKFNAGVRSPFYVEVGGDAP